MKKHTLNAADKSLGRLASEAAVLLRGKDSAAFEPSEMPDSSVTIENLAKARFTGSKLATKVYHRYSGYHGGIRSQTLAQRWATAPRELFRKMVYDMLPKNRQRDKIIKNLKFQ